MATTITVTLRRNYGYQGKNYGPGVTEIPIGLAAALGISADGEPQDKPASTAAAGARAPGAEPVDYAGMTKAELEAAAQTRGLTVEGSGAEGHVLKADLVAALEAADGAAG